MVLGAQRQECFDTTDWYRLFQEKIPSEIEVAPRYTLFTLLTLFSLFILYKLLYMLSNFIYAYIYC